jgi:predicted regulator of Ras-like GTPase activity (Roadblock/LC7/MglB family)
VPGARAALLLDSTGELVMAAGARDEGNRLVGAYQGIALAEAQRAAARHGAGDVQELISRYEGGIVILQPLKDGYYLVLVLGPRAGLALGRQRLGPAQDRMNQAL